MDPKQASRSSTSIPKDMASKSTTRWIALGGVLAVGIWYASSRGYLGSAGDKMNQASRGGSKPPTATDKVDKATEGASPTEGKKK